MTNPLFTQVTFRLRNDDNNEASASWRQNQGVDDSIPTGLKFRCRFLVDETNSRTWTNKTWNLYYQLTGDATYYAVTGSTPIQHALSTWFADADDCTSQLTGGVGSFLVDNNGMNEAGGATNTGAAGNFFEVEYCLLIDSNQVVNGNTINLRVYDGSTAINAYTDQPVITVVETAIVCQTPSSTSAAIALTVVAPGPDFIRSASTYIAAGGEN